MWRWSQPSLTSTHTRGIISVHSEVHYLTLVVVHITPSFFCSNVYIIAPRDWCCGTPAWVLHPTSTWCRASAPAACGCSWELSQKMINILGPLLWCGRQGWGSQSCFQLAAICNHFWSVPADCTSSFYIICRLSVSPCSVVLPFTYFFQVYI